VISERKLKKSASSLSLELERTKDILEELGKKKENRILVGFAAETEDLIANAKKKLTREIKSLII
jgi:phosphopantothenoylcysteine decarboxylase/phosphopantothenate--cysteine ligase